MLVACKALAVLSMDGVISRLQLPDGSTPLNREIFLLFLMQILQPLHQSKDKNDMSRDAGIRARRLGQVGRQHRSLCMLAKIVPTISLDMHAYKGTSTHAF